MMTKVTIKGVIVSNDDKWVYEWFDMEATSPSDVTGVIEGLDGEDLLVEINSVGGDVFAGSEIYTALKKYPGKVTVDILGIAASAASVVAMAGDTVRISPTAQIMIHNVSSSARGDHRVMQHESDVLKNYNKTIANAYRLKTGLSEDKLLELMDEETWLNAQQAKELGFVDEILFDDNKQLVASYSNSVILPKQVINKIRNIALKNEIDGKEIAKALPRKDVEKKTHLYEARIRLLKMKGEMFNG